MGVFDFYKAKITLNTLKKSYPHRTFELQLNTPNSHKTRETETEKFEMGKKKGDAINIHLS